LLIFERPVLSSATSFNFFTVLFLHFGRTQEREQIMAANRQPFTAGETWFAVSARWWRSWSLYVGIGDATGGSPTLSNSPSAAATDDAVMRDRDDAAASAAAAPPPGPIDNSDIAGECGGVDLKAGLAEPYDYVLVHSSAHACLLEWHGLVGASFPRAAVTPPGAGTETIVEVYPFCVPIAVADASSGEPDTEAVQYQLFSRRAPPAALADVLARFLPLAGAPPTPPVPNYAFAGRARCRLWVHGAFAMLRAIYFRVDE
jgi:hypothetical protein